MLRKILQNNFNFHMKQNKRYFCFSNTETIKESLEDQMNTEYNFHIKKTSRIIGISELLIPQGSKKKYQNNKYIQDMWVKQNSGPIQKIAAFYRNPKTKLIFPYGTYAEITKLDFDEYVLSPLDTDTRVTIKNFDSCQFEGESNEIVELIDHPSKFRYLDNSISKNIVQEINNVISLFYEFSSKQFLMDQSFSKELNNIFSNIQELMMKNDLKPYSGKDNISIHPLTVNKMVFGLFDNFLTMFNNLKHYYPLQEVTSIIQCQDPLLRAKLLIDFIYDIADSLMKDIHMHNEYRKDTSSKQEKLFLRFAQKKIDKLIGTESQEEYIKKLDKLEINPSTKRAIELEIQSALAQTSNEGFEMDEKKKIGIIEDIFSFPWNTREKVEFDLEYAKMVFEENLFGLEKVKQRIYEYISKLKRTHKSNKGFVILVYGPPGTGKTSIANLIGKSLKRKTKLINFSGESDIVQLKGIKRTYVDSGPSVFFKELVKLGVKNPVIVLDEIDKLGTDWRGGNPQSALLELLNPEENYNFIDHYLNIPLDFSECIFICTANGIHNILEPLLDRMELIYVDAYTNHEKLEIARRYLLNKNFADHGLLNSNLINFPVKILEKLISDYVFGDAGVRSLNQKIESIIRKANLELYLDKDKVQMIDITEDKVKKYLGAPPSDQNYLKLIKEVKDFGSVLISDSQGYMSRIYVDTNNTKMIEELIHISNKKESFRKILKTTNELFEKFNINGFLEDVVKESLDISKQLASNKIYELCLTLNNKEKVLSLISKKHFTLYFSYPYQKRNDSSYGLGLYITLISSALNLKIPNNFVILGEISPIGKIFKIGHLINHIDICLKYNIENVIIPQGNKSEYETMSEDLKSRMKNIYFVSTIEETFNIVFKKEFVEEHMKKLQTAQKYTELKNILI